MVTVCFDVDDVCNELTRVAMERAGVAYSRCTNYNLRLNYSDSEIARIKEQFQSIDCFKACGWVPDIHKISLIGKRPDVKVVFNSVCYNDEVVEFKREGLLRFFGDWLNEENLIFQVTSASENKSAVYADIVVEDRYENILKYSTRKAGILMMRHYNTWYSATKLMSEGILPANNLTEAIKLIEKALR